MTKKIISRVNALSSLQWWSGFDRDDLNAKASVKTQAKEDELYWPFYTA